MLIFKSALYLAIQVKILEGFFFVFQKYMNGSDSGHSDYQIKQQQLGS